jgi:hypothetical protein
MSQATAAEPATSQGPLELSRVQMNAEAGRTGVPSGRRAVQAGGRTT